MNLEIFDVKGRLVRTLVDRFVGGGTQLARWEGTDALGGRVSSGVYFYRLHAPGFSEAQKMMLPK